MSSSFEQPNVDDGIIMLSASRSSRPVIDDELPEKPRQRAWEEFKNLPWDLIDTFRWQNIRSTGYPWWRRGDFDGFFALWGDNLGTQLCLIGILTLSEEGVSPGRAIQKVMPGIGISLVFGNLYYAMQASKLANKERRTDVCAQPYGITTPSAMMKAYVIFLPVFKENLAKSGNADAAFDQALEVTCACNLFGAVVEIILAFILPFVADQFSSAALLSPLAGMGISWLGVHLIQALVSVDPVVGLLSLVMVWYGTFAGGKLGHIPIVLLSIILGTSLSWVTGQTRKFENIVISAQNVQFSIGTPGACFQDWSQVLDYMTLLLPIAMTNALGSLECVRASQELGGDDYSAMETMLVDGIGSMIGAFFGSPFGTTVYSGHPAYKKMGASRGYSLLNGIFFFCVGIFGLHGLFDAIIPQECVLVLVLFVGFLITVETINLSPTRWRPAVILGLVIPVFDWVKVIVDKATEKALDGVENFTILVEGTYCPAPRSSNSKIMIYPTPAANTTIADCLGPKTWKKIDLHHGNFLPGAPGINIMKNGFLLISFMWTCGFISVTDRKMFKAGVIWFVCSFMACFGLIHSNKMSLPKGYSGTGTEPHEEGGGWMFIVAYFLMGVFCWSIYVLQYFGLTDGPICRNDGSGGIWGGPPSEDDELDGDGTIPLPRIGPLHHSHYVAEPDPESNPEGRGHPSPRSRPYNGRRRKRRRSPRMWTTSLSVVAEI